MLLAATLAPAEPAGPGSFDRLGAFVGEWTLNMSLAPESWGQQVGPGHGTMRCRCGPERHWIDCDMASVYDTLGDYIMKIVLYPTHTSDTLGSFVTNSFGGGMLYSGR